MTGLETLRFELDEELMKARDVLAARHAQEGPASGHGLEAVIAGATLGVSKKTWLLPGKREQNCVLLRGADAERRHASRPYRVVPPGEDPVQRARMAVGLGQEGESALVFLGTGSLSYGEVIEALSLASLTGAQVCFVVSWYQGEGPFAAQLPVEPAALAQGLGLASEVVDGRDAVAVRNAVKGTMPRLVQANLRGRA